MKRLFLVSILLLTVGVLPQCRSDRAERTREIPVKNVIFLIGDGMGLVQVSAAMLDAPHPLALERATYTGFQKTASASNKVTDSAAAATALATGVKTYNGAIGVGPDTLRLISILERAASAGLSTGLVATSRITHATPASFIAHQPSRKLEEAIAADFLDTGITCFIGGGRELFERRADGRDLSDELRAEGIRVVYTMDELAGVDSGRVAGLMHEGHLPRIARGRDPEYLPDASNKAFDLLSRNDNGFFVLIEGSQIDGGGHGNDMEAIVTELLDFDRAVGAAFDFADTHPGTLVVVTADHETGGLTIPASGRGVYPHFSTGSHTGTMVPVYAYGAGAERFTGIMENTEIPTRMKELLGL